MQVLNFVAVNASQGYPAMSYLIITECGSFFTSASLPNVKSATPRDAKPCFVRNGAAYDSMQKAFQNQQIIAQGRSSGFTIKQFGLVS